MGIQIKLDARPRFSFPCVIQRQMSRILNSFYYLRELLGQKTVAKYLQPLFNNPKKTFVLPFSREPAARTSTLIQFRVSDRFQSPA